MTAWRVHTATLFYSLLAALPDVDLFLDVGSLDGRESFAVEARFPSLKCIAFEPNPRNIALIQQEIARRNSRLDLRTVAVGKEDGTVSFYTRTPLNSRNYGASSVLKFASESRNDEFATSAIEVPIHRLDAIEPIPSHEKIALWIDVEGAGYQVLEGLAGIAPKVQLVHMEVETRSLFEDGKLATDVMQIMKSYGLDLIGSNLDSELRRDQGDMVFLRTAAVSQKKLKQAIFQATLVEQFAVQKIALKVLPPPVYRSGRDWLVQLVTAR